MTRTRSVVVSTRRIRTAAGRSSVKAVGAAKTIPPPKSVVIAGIRLPVSPVLDTLFYFLAERHQILQRRIAGDPQPWTEDSILEAYPFTNVFRVYDRTTQYILQHVVRKGSKDLHESCFRVMLFRAFNKIETWEHLTYCLGPLTWKDFDVRKYEVVLRAAGEKGPLYSPAYIMPAPNLGGHSNASNHLRLIQLMMELDFPGLLQEVDHLKDAHGRISLLPSMGDFTALQLLLDLNLLPHFHFDEDEWVALGPGAVQCVRKIFGPAVRGHENDALDWLHETQHDHFARLGIRADRIPRLHESRPGGATKVDLEHTLCEVEKYSRARHPEIKGKKKNVARSKFVPHRKRPTAELPDHWLANRRAPASFHHPPPIDPTDPNPAYEVSHIVAEKSSGSQYLVRWVGYGPEDDTWMRESELTENASELLERWQSLKGDIHDMVIEFQAMGNTYKRVKSLSGPTTTKTTTH
ncbi:hypothetical protein B0H21DRAFT_699281 [Amylocystis lapponica]|nr:hypothetical protein B0H21DRAFT_699281 [Amylocystis lapponica]